ncbi:rho GTPase-activating protein 11A isoform X1 [Takifugu rubripes]|uniref:Rho GTPase activating protein 11A n=1 Tax=Takifugu rubripes TaxID=31033 RepID=A0A674NC49_TAKRU|nr:rho GTPase-activating protein 11A isoform X1 [Takifugu rubripes]
MKAMEKNVMRLVAVQHLRTAYGIKTKNWNKHKATSCKTTSTSVKVFGVPLESLPYYNMDCGSVPSFLVDACMRLMAHVNTEGLFRKSGSVVRLKALKAKLDAGEECLSTALPCDIAGLVKQFFRELPEPVLPSELQEAFIKAQQLPSEEERTSATMLLSCVLPDRNLTTLRHFFNFLQNVSKRSAENKMDSSNLAVILAPNLLHFGDGTEKMNASTERRIKLQATVVHRFIENASSFGVLPQFLQGKVPAMMGCESGVLSPNLDELEEPDVISGVKKRNRRSFGDVVSGALNKIKSNRTPTSVPQSDSLVFSSVTPVIATPSSKRKLPLESGHSFGFSNKKRRSVKKNLGMELLPSALFSGTSTPGSAYSASGVLDSSQNILSPAGRSRRPPATSVRRKSRRLSSRNAIARVESGRTGCFSPSVNKKEAPRKSLRLRFSLGKSSKDAGSESIGWRLATQESTTSFRCTKEAEFSPSFRHGNAEAKACKYISKSEDNLLTPCGASSAHQTSWGAETPAGTRVFSGESFSDTPMKMCLKSTYTSEPAMVVSKPPAAAALPKTLCCASSADSLESQNLELRVQSRASPTLMKVKNTEPGCDLGATEPRGSAGANAAKPSDRVINPPPETPEGKVLSADAGTPSFLGQCRYLTSDQNITFSQIELGTLTPLHIDSVIFEPDAYRSPPRESERASFWVVPSRTSSMVGEAEKEAEQVNCSRMVEALDIHGLFDVGVHSRLRSTPYKLNKLDGEDGKGPGATSQTGAVASAEHTVNEGHPEVGSEVQNQHVQAASSPETEKRHVADHIHHFNKLTLHSPRASRLTQIRSPLKFQRTPVRQAVRRINSLMGESRRCSQTPSRVVKAVSLESGLSPHPQLQSVHTVGLPSSACPLERQPPVPPKKPSTLSRKPKACALGDITNKIQPKSRTDDSVCDTAVQKPIMDQMEKDMNHYRGSPRNPLNQGRLMSATRPVDL